MREFIKRLLKLTPLNLFIHNWRERRRQLREFTRWENSGKPLPPPHWVKQQRLRSFSASYGLTVLIETGTYYGEMVEAMRKLFDHIYSIELNEHLYNQAKKRFHRAKHIDIILGDSAIELGKLMSLLDRPALFWLDGHYSGGETSKGQKETPIYEELQHIFNFQDKGHVVLIDDARLFGTDPHYPTLDELQVFIKTSRPNLDFFIKDDCIHLVPKTAA